MTFYKFCWLFFPIVDTLVWFIQTLWRNVCSILIEHMFFKLISDMTLKIITKYSTLVWCIFYFNGWSYHFVNYINSKPPVLICTIRYYYLNFSLGIYLLPYLLGTLLWISHVMFFPYLMVHIFVVFLTKSQRVLIFPDFRIESCVAKRLFSLPPVTKWRWFSLWNPQ